MRERKRERVRERERDRERERETNLVKYCFLFYETSSYD